MPSSVEAITTAALSAALEAASRRHGAIAANIANASADGYAALRPSFSTQLEEARSMLREQGVLDRAGIEAIRGGGEFVPEESGAATKVHLDAEMAQLARNSVEFQTLTQALSRHLAFLALAAADGKR
jgi:flagellar basal-body rod protein FlgB